MPLATSMDHIRSALSAHEPTRLEAVRQAAVSAILKADGHHETSVLLIERTRRDDDPWSGQMAFPGGRVDERDRDPLAAAMREAREEVGVDLAEQAHLLGRLDDVRAMAGGRRLELVITPFVFEVAAPRPLDLVLQPEEVASTLWAPVEEIASGRLDGSFTLHRPGSGTFDLPCWHVQGKVVWGLTYMMLRSLLQIVDTF